MNVIVVGATGLVGSNFVTTALNSPKVNEVWSFSRRSLPESMSQSKKLRSIVEKDSLKWEKEFPQDATAILSGVATTRADAGGIDQQAVVDHNLQIRLAAAAKERGCKCFVLVSSTGADAHSAFSYLRLKGETENGIIGLGFDKTIILRPGPLLGKRLKPHNGYGSMFIEKFMPWFHRSLLQSLLRYPVHGQEVASCAFKLIQELPNGVHYVESRQILETSEQPN